MVMFMFILNRYNAYVKLKIKVNRVLNFREKNDTVKKNIII